MSRLIARLAAHLAAGFAFVLTAGAEVVVTTMPAGMLQAPNGAPPSDRFVVKNTAGASVAVTVVISRGNFFSVSPTSLVLQAGETQTIEIQAIAAPVVVNSGSISLLVPGQREIAVPVKLLVTEPPASSIALRAVDQRVLTDPRPPPLSPAPPPPPVMVSFINDSTAPVRALVVSDSAWLQPLADDVTLPAGGTAAVAVQIDPTGRPDGADPIGAASGKVSLLFFGGPSTTSQSAPVTQTSTVVVHVNKAQVVSGTPPPLQVSDLAFFVGRFAGGVDLSLFAGGDDANIRDFRLFYERAGMSRFSLLPTNTGISFVDLVGASGSVQIRTPDFANLNLAATKTSISQGLAYSAVMPILTSSQGALPGSSLYLPGVAKDATTRTDLHLQEVGGNPVSVRIDFLDANGTVVSSESRALVGFASAYIADAVPANASTVVVWNDASSSGRVSAIALVTDAATGDVWPIRDGGVGAGAPGDAFFVAAADERANARVDVHVVNRGSTVAMTQFEVRLASESRRRRAVRHSSGTPDAAAVSLPPNASTTFSLPATSSGAYARLTSTGGALVVSGRALSTSSAGAYGSALPVVAEPAVLRAGASRSFAGIEDAARTTVASRVPLTFRSELLLIETSRSAPATVRLTLRYTASTGLAFARLVNRRDIQVSAGAFMFLRPLASEIIGNTRDEYGDLRNMVLTVEVVAGAGHVIPIVRTIENHSGDITMRGQ